MYEEKEESSTFTIEETVFNHMVVQLWRDIEIMAFNWSETEFENDLEVLDLLINQIYMLFIAGGVPLHRPKCRRWLISTLQVGVTEDHTEDDTL